MSNAIFEARDIYKSYTLGGQTLEILTGVDFSISEGEMVGIVGTSGAGKSTLLHILGLLDWPDKGEIFFRNQAVNFKARKQNAQLRNKSLGFVFQFYHLLPELTALENVVLNPMMDCGVVSWFSARNEAREKAADLLSSLGLENRMRHKPNQLSGGERQRVAIARALFSNPVVLLCDEPTGNLDEKTSDTIVDLLFQINEERGQTMVIVTHNEGFAGRMPRLDRLSEGRLNPVTLSQPATA